MAVAIRLRREGNRNRAYYRIVVADKRARRDGRFIETIGTYDPNQDGTNYKVDVERAEDWISKGAQPSDTVRSLIKKARREADAAPAVEKEEAPAVATKAEVPAAKVEAEAPVKVEAEAPAAEAEEAPAAEAPAPEAEAPAEAEASAEEKDAPAVKADPES